MKRAASFAIVLITAPDMKTARHLAGSALKKHLIACANLIPRVESHYRWQGKLDSSREVLMMLKTRRANLARLKALILDAHPYDTPEFLVLSLDGGAKAYLEWLAASC